MHILLCVFLFVFANADRKKQGKQPKCDDVFIDHQPNTDQEFPQMMEPVPFGHITVEGFGDPYLKRPIDFLELLLKKPKTREEALRLLKTDRKNILLIDPKLPKINNEDEETMKEDKMQNPPPLIPLKWYDLSSIQTRNAMYPSKYAPQRKPTTSAPVELPYIPKKPYFTENEFHFGPDSLVNWTTCAQFAVNAIFSAKDIVKVKWTPFYVWTDMSIAASKEHVFEYPTDKLVQEYRAKYGKFIKKDIDWSQPKLLLRGISEMLLIAADKRGLFDAIVKHEIPESLNEQSAQLPPLSLRIKIEDPYLALMHCEYHYATLMAISGNEPVDIKEMEAEAATINFTGIGRPIWKDFEEEKRNMMLLQEAALRGESEKSISVDNPMQPRLRQWDTARLR